MLELAKTRIFSTLQEAYDKDYISKDEFQAMDPTEKTPGRFYELFKVHKEHIPGETPSERPIISGSGSITENISLLVEHFIKDLSMKHPSFLQDTPDFLRIIEDINSEGPYQEIVFLSALMFQDCIQISHKMRALSLSVKLLMKKVFLFPKSFFSNYLNSHLNLTFLSSTLNSIYNK